MSELQRYSMQIIGGAHALEVDAAADPDGAWVKFSDLPSWQPIETAPRDGTSILVAWMFMNKWRVCEVYYEPKCEPDPWIVDWDGDEERPTSWVCGPLKWQHLPAGPA